MKYIEDLDFSPGEFFKKYDIKWMKGVEVTGIDTKEKKLKLDNGEDLPYEKVVLATGASSFLPPIENLRTANNVIGLRNLDDAIRIKEIAPKVKNIIMGSWLSR